MIENPLNYLGFDWAGMTFTFVAIYLLGNKSRYGFTIMICGNTCWVVVGVLSGSLAMLIANVVFALMNVRAWLNWADTPPSDV